MTNKDYKEYVDDVVETAQDKSKAAHEVIDNKWDELSTTVGTAYLKYGAIVAGILALIGLVIYLRGRSTG